MARKKSKMTAKMYADRRDYLVKVAGKYNFDYIGGDSDTFRASFTDNTALFKIDIYLSKNTVCLKPEGEKPKYFKNQSWQQIEEIFKNPFRI